MPSGNADRSATIDRPHFRPHELTTLPEVPPTRPARRRPVPDYGCTRRVTSPGVRVKRLQFGVVQVASLGRRPRNVGSDAFPRGSRLGGLVNLEEPARASSTGRSARRPPAGGDLQRSGLLATGDEADELGPRGDLQATPDPGPPSTKSRPRRAGARVDERGTRLRATTVSRQTRYGAGRVALPFVPRAGGHP